MIQWIKYALFAGIVLFIWYTISWMVLPWHCKSFKSFTNETALMQLMTANASGSGVYVLPCPKASEGKEHQGPSALVTYNQEGYGRIDTKLFATFIFDVATAFIALWLMALSGIQGYSHKVTFVMLLGLFTGLVALIPHWIWLDFSPELTIVSTAELIVGWALAGLVLGNFETRKA